ncbi:MAG: Gfo/Idh/MocA family oxidoreductase [Planctomycetota bacterium]
MKLQLGLIGLGRGWETRHRPALRMLHDRFDVRAVYSSVSKLAENCAAEFQADPVDGYRALVNRSDLDAVLILDRCWHGWLPLLAAAEAGKAIYWASELDFDAHRDSELRGTVEQSGVAFMPEFPRRFSPATLRLKELIATRLGAPKLIFCHRRLLPESKTLHREFELNRSHREMVEAIDWCRYIVGRPPDSVISCGQSPYDVHVGVPSLKQGVAPEYQSLSLQFDPGTAADGQTLTPVTAQISCGSYIPAAWREAAGFRPPAEMHVCCERGVAFLDMPNNLVWFDDAGRHLESLEEECPVGERLLRHFHRMVVSLVRSLDELDDVFAASSILNAAEESQVLGRRIMLRKNSSAVEPTDTTWP